MRAGSRHGLSNPCHNDIRAADHDLIRQAQNAPALRAQPFVAAGIVNLPAGPFVRRAIELDDELRIDTHLAPRSSTERSVPEPALTRRDCASVSYTHLTLPTIYS